MLQGRHTERRGRAETPRTAARAVLPAATNFALLVNPTNSAAAEPVSRSVQAAARTRGIKLHVLHGSSEREFDAVFATATRLQAAGLVIGSDIFFNKAPRTIAGFGDSAFAERTSSGLVPR